MAVPITLRCDCGETHRAVYGQRVRCMCGKVYDTSTLPAQSLSGVFRSQFRMRLYTTMGGVFVAGTSVIAAILFGTKGLAVGLPLSGLLWFRIIGPAFRRRVFHGAGELPRWKLDATEIAEE